MIVRLVKMTFRASDVMTFKDLFERTKTLIRHFDGCEFLELLQDTHQSTVFFTHSHWRSEKHLAHYGQSELFRSTWSQTKVLFAEKPEAWSTELVSSLNDVH